MARSRTFRNFKKQGKKYTNFLRTMIDQRKTNVVRKTLGYVSRKMRGSKNRNRSKRFR
jgi:hypothetical protein